MAPRENELTTRGGDDDESGTRRMFDKRTLRKMYKQHFDTAIEAYREDPVRVNRALQSLPPSGTAVFVRKRPLFSNETEDFDCVTCIAKGNLPS
jgi:hypothetical protein